ncbi:glycosyltransferase, partial [Candidatus Woesearchaeota archaeon]|nr:glycosyltransferase [Candidatus Woesearchaeota archaeon]
MKILALQETSYVNEWLGLLDKHDVTALLIRPNPKLMAIKSYHSYSDDCIRKIYLPYKARGRNVASVGLFDHVMYTLYSLLTLPIALVNDAVIFVTPSYFHTIAIPILKLFGKKIYVIVIDPQEVLRETAKKGVMARLYFWIASYLEYVAVKKADKVFAVSTYLKNKYSKWNRHVFLTPNGADTEYIGKIRPARSDRRFTIAYFGSFDKYRGVDILAEAFLKIKRKNARLLLLGGGKEESNIREICKGSKNIYISGFIRHQDAIAMCKSADVLVIPFRKSPILYMTSPIKTFEYSACGVPVIATDTGEHADIIKNLGGG